MPFTLDTWKANLRQRLPGWRTRMQRLGITSAYATVSAAALWPVVEAAHNGEWAALAALGSVVAGVGGNLLANQLQSWQDESDAVRQLAATVGHEPALRAEMDAVLEKLDVLTAAREALPAAEHAWYVATLREELGRLGSPLRDLIIAGGDVATDHSAIAKDGGVAVVGDNNLVNTGQIGGSVVLPGGTLIVEDGTAAAAEAAAARARRCYLEHLRRQCQALPLAALGGDETGDQEITLDQVYIELDTTTRMPLTDEEKQALKERGPSLRTERGDDTRPLTALEAVAQAPRLALLGEPGAGKSTFARMVLARLAAAHLDGVEPPPGVTKELLPILVTLRDLVPRLHALELAGLSADHQEAALAAVMRDQVLADLARLEATDCAAALRSALVDGRCLLVLDGLDEVPQALRQRVRQTVAAVIRQYAPQRIIVTCRIRSYVGDAVLPGFREHTLAPFDDERIQDFVTAWYNAQKLLGRVDAEQARGRTADLAQAALGADLRELAANPMMLTTMAIIHQKEIGLPRERVRLYNLAVDVLLRRWQKRKTGEQGIAPSPALADFLKADLRLRATLERLAYEAQRQGSRHGEAAELERGRALTLLETPEYLGSAPLADEFLDYVDQRAGLLVGRGGELGGPTTYAFPHRTFQEYLAGCCLIGQREGQAARAYFAHADDGETWRLAALLGAEELFYNRRTPYAVLDLAYRLCPATEPADERARRANLWAGAMAVLAGREAIERDTASPDGGRAFLQRLISRLLGLLGVGLPAADRADAGRLLGKLGDPRGAVMTLEDMEFCWVPAGPFWLGSDRKHDPSSTDDERPTKKMDLPAYYISRQPITNAQYREFVAAGGYRDERFWTEARAASVWQNGEVRGRWDDHGFVAAEDYGEPFNLPNYPVVGVTWYEALALTRWLTEQWQAQGILLPGWTVTLPSETQWEKAARGGLRIPVQPVFSKARGKLRVADSVPLVDSPARQRIYPWQGDLTPEHANYGETKLSTTSAVGVFSRGASPYGALDMSGNMWEWCLTKYRGNYRTQEDNDPEGTDPRVMRGGAFYNGAWRVRCAARVGSDPYDRNGYVGFRVVAPALPEGGKGSPVA